MAGEDAWIHMVTAEEADEELRARYERLRDPSTGEVDNILRIHGQHPATLDAHYLLYRTVMQPSPSLSRAEREMIAVVVSALNRCLY